MNALPSLLMLTAATATSSRTDFEVLTLARAVALAGQNNPDARTASLRIHQAQAALEEADAQFWPRLGLEASYSATNNPAIAFGYFVNQEAIEPTLDFNDLPTVDDLNLKATLQTLLWAGGQRFARQDSALQMERAAEAQAKAVQDRLAFGVARTYFTILKARGFVRAAAASVVAYEEAFRVAQERLRSGTLLKQQLLDVAVRRARAREERVRAQNAEVLGLRALENLLGVEIGTARIPDDAVPLRTPKADGSSWDRRPELSVAHYRRQGAEAQVRSARAGYWPQLLAFGSVLFDQGFVNDGRRLSFVAGVSLAWSAWDGFETRARVRQAEASARSAEEAVRRGELALRLELQQARIRLQDATERLKVTEDEIDLARESAELSRSRFQEGLALSTELIDAETALTAAEVRRLDSEAELRIAVAALRRASGLPIVETGEPK